jgi:hypothetical protein
LFQVNPGSSKLPATCKTITNFCSRALLSKAKVGDRKKSIAVPNRSHRGPLLKLILIGSGKAAVVDGKSAGADGTNPLIGRASPGSTGFNAVAASAIGIVISGSDVADKSVSGGCADSIRDCFTGRSATAFRPTLAKPNRQIPTHITADRGRNVEVVTRLGLVMTGRMGARFAISLDNFWDLSVTSTPTGTGRATSVFDMGCLLTAK